MEEKFCSAKITLQNLTLNNVSLPGDLENLTWCKEYVYAIFYTRNEELF